MLIEFERGRLEVTCLLKEDYSVEDVMCFPEHAQLVVVGLMIANELKRCIGRKPFT